MKIVVTDGYTLNPGDLSWDAIQSFGDLVVYDRTPTELIVERCRGAEMVLTNKTPLNRHTLGQLPGLQLVSVLATGYNVVDTIAAKERGVVVCNVPGYGTASVSQHVFALLLELTNHVGRNSRATAGGKWERAADWCFTEAPVTELHGKTFGIVGMGNIGQQTARIANAFGMRVIYYNRSAKAADAGEPRDLAALFSESDIVTLHCSLNNDNKEFINKELLSTMKSSAFLINTARGQLINEHDLAEALNTGVISGAALDVLSQEPPLSTNPLLKAKNCLITPHNAWISREARQRIIDVTTANIHAFLQQAPQNIVN